MRSDCCNAKLKEDDVCPKCGELCHPVKEPVIKRYANSFKNTKKGGEKNGNNSRKN